MSQAIKKVDQSKKEAYQKISSFGKGYLEKIGFYRVYHQYSGMDLEFGSSSVDGSLSFWLLGYHLFTVRADRSVDFNRSLLPSVSVFPEFSMDDFVNLDRYIKDLFYDKETKKTVVGLLSGLIYTWRATENSVKFQTYYGDYVEYIY